MNIVRQLRKKKGIQQKQLALEIGVSQPTVSDWESNKTDPSGERLKKLAEYFNVDELFILGYGMDAPNLFVPDNPKRSGVSETEQIVQYVLDKLNAIPSATAKDAPKTVEGIIVSAAVDKMPPEDREKALNMLKAVYSDYFDSTEERMA